MPKAFAMRVRMSSFALRRPSSISAMNGCDATAAVARARCVSRFAFRAARIIPPRVFPVEPFLLCMRAM